MPVMPRTKSRATKIAYKILGKPANLEFKRDKKQQKIDRRLVFEETQRAR